MIRHTVAFRLKHSPGSTAEASFLLAAQGLATIPGVRAFECFRQVSAKNPYTFGLSMEFQDQQEYLRYQAHEDHERFLQQHWIPEVAEFLEIDYVPYRENR